MNMFKVVLIGDVGSGKSTLLYTFQNGKFPEDYTPTVVDIFDKDVDYNNKNHTLQLCDTTGQDDFDDTSYTKADSFLVCFDVSDRKTFENVEKIWYKDLCCKMGNFTLLDLVVLLVGCKSDLRDGKKAGKNSKTVSLHEASELATKIGGEYLECSAKINYNVDLIFEKATEKLAIQQALTQNKAKKKKKKKKKKETGEGTNFLGIRSMSTGKKSVRDVVGGKSPWD